MYKDWTERVKKAANAQRKPLKTFRTIPQKPLINNYNKVWLLENKI